MFPNKCTLEKMTDLLALVAHIIGVFPHGILQGLLIELGRRGGEGLTFHLVLKLYSEKTLSLDIFIQLSGWLKNISKIWMRNRSVLK